MSSSLTLGKGQFSSGGDNKTQEQLMGQGAPKDTEPPTLTPPTRHPGSKKRLGDAKSHSWGCGLAAEEILLQPLEMLRPGLCM